MKEYGQPKYNPSFERTQRSFDSALAFSSFILCWAHQWRECRFRDEINSLSPERQKLRSSISAYGRFILIRSIQIEKLAFIIVGIASSIVS
jgi:hypothetical protein